MSDVTSVEIDSGGMMVIEAHRPLGNSMNGSTLFDGEWGIAADGTPYYDTAGASPGEAALLSISSDGTLVLSR